MSYIEEKLSRDAREKEHKLELSDQGMAMDPEDIPHGAAQDPDEKVVTPAHADE